jgi:hypothetical protein
MVLKLKVVRQIKCRCHSMLYTNLKSNYMNILKKGFILKKFRYAALILNIAVC